MKLLPAMFLKLFSHVWLVGSLFILVKLRAAVMTSGKPQCNEMYKNKAASWIKKKKRG